MVDNPAASGRAWKISVRVFAVFAIVYLCTWAGHYTTGDGGQKIAWAKAMFLPKDAVAGEPLEHGVYSKYGIGHSLIAAPPLIAAYYIRKATGIHAEAALYTLIFVVNGALFLALLAFYLAYFYTSRLVWATVLMVGLGTIWWPYTKLDFSEPLVLTTAFLGFVLMRFGRPVLGLLIAGFTLTLRLDSIVIVIPLILWYLFQNRTVRAAVLAGLSLAPAIVLVMVANYIRYHSLFDRGYSGEGFTNPLLVGLYGNLFSAGKSVFLFSPPLLLGLAGWRKFMRAPETRLDAWLFLAIFVGQLALFAKWWDWSSDDAWGVRFVIPGVMLMCIPIITLLDRRAIAGVVFAAGVLVQLLVVPVGGLDYLLLVRHQNFERQALYVGGRERIDFEDIRFDPRYSQLMGNWILLRELLRLAPAPGPDRDATQIGTSLYNAISPGAWAKAARWDFIWNVRSLPVTSGAPAEVAPAPAH